VATPEESVAEAARRMREAGVGTLVVLAAGERPLGILTDRDIVLRCVAEGRDPEATRIEQVMTAPLVCVGEATPIEDALARMIQVPSRRLGVTEADGKLAGLLALDDVIELLAEEAATIGKLLRQAR
jgi:CBS domain-containing protein